MTEETSTIQITITVATTIMEGVLIMDRDTIREIRRMTATTEAATTGTDTEVTAPVTDMEMKAIETGTIIVKPEDTVMILEIEDLMNSLTEADRKEVKTTDSTELKITTPTETIIGGAEIPAAIPEAMIPLLRSEIITVQTSDMEPISMVAMVRATTQTGMNHPELRLLEPASRICGNRA